MSDIDTLAAEHAGLLERITELGELVAGSGNREQVEAFNSLCAELRDGLNEAVLPVLWRYHERERFDRINRYDYVTLNDA